MMISFKTTLLRFDKQGEKTGWTYFVIPKKTAEKLNPGIKVSFRVKGSIDDCKIKSVALLPMGEGDFIMPVKAAMRKTLRKYKGDTINVSLELDKTPFKMSAGLLECLEDEPKAREYFNKLTGSHQKYFSNWIESAKTDGTKTKRIALALNAFSKKMSFSEMIRLQQKDK